MGADRSGMKLPRTHFADRTGVAAVQSAVAEVDWLFREQVISDFGIDAEIEIVDGGRSR
jgi:hypothetical protein